MSNQLVGRDRELQLLSDCYQLACEGDSQFVFIQGDIGWGKSALIEHFHEHCVRGAVIAKGSCLISREGGEPYFPFLELLSALSESRTDELDESVEDQMLNYGKVFAEVLWDNSSDLIGTLIPGSSNIINTVKKVEGYINCVNDKLNEVNAEVEELTAQIDTGQLQLQYKKVLEALAEKYPLVLTIDSIQWADKSSIDLLFYLSRKLKKSRILFIYCLNDGEMNHSEGGDSQLLKRAMNELHVEENHHWLNLKPSKASDRVKLLRTILAKDPNEFSEDFVSSLFKYTNGNPFFTLELLRHLKVQGDVTLRNGLWHNNSKLVWEKLPQNIEGIIGNKISQLPGELQDLLALSSVEGQVFSCSVIAKLRGVEERELAQLFVNKLIKTHSLIEEDQPQQIGDSDWIRRYKFMNGISQQYLYHNLPTTERMILHSQIAVAMEGIYQEFGIRLDGQLAYHYSKGGNEKKAAEYFHKSAKHAIRVGAYKKAIEDLQRSIQLLPHNPIGSEVDFACQVQIDLALATRITYGWGDEHTHETYKCCIQLAEKYNRQRAIIPIVFGVWGYHLVKNDIRRTYATAQHLLKLAIASEDKIAHAQALIAMANSCFWKGCISESQQYLEEFYGSFDPLLEFDAEERYGQSPFSISYMMSSLTYLHQGDFAEAAVFIEKTVTLLEQTGNPFTRSICLTTLTWAHWLMGNAEESEQYANQLDSMAKKYDIELYRIYGFIFKGYAFIEKGELTEAQRVISLSEEMSDRMEQKIMSSIRKLIEFEMYLKQQKYVGLFRESSDWISRCKACEECCYLSEFYRYQALGHFYAGDHQAAMVAYDQAIKIAQEKGQLLFERRATLDYLSLLERTGGCFDLQNILRRRLDHELVIKKICIVPEALESQEASLMDLL